MKQFGKNKLRRGDEMIDFGSELVAVLGNDCRLALGLFGEKFKIRSLVTTFARQSLLSN